MVGSENIMEERLANDGRVLSDCNIVRRPMISNSCHYNSAQLVIDHQESEYNGGLEMWSGWGLNDEYWRGHSWVIATEETTLFPFESEEGVQERETVGRGTIIETTTERETYYGVQLTESEFDRISYMHGAF